MKFYDNRNQEHNYLGVFSEVSISSFPFLDIIQQRDLSKYKLDDLSFDNIFQLKVNVKKVGSVVFLFKKEDFNREDFTRLVAPLGELPSITIGDAINKVRSLFEIALRFSPLVAIYYPYGECSLFPECFETLVCGLNTLYVNGFNESLLNVKKQKPKKEEKPKPVVKEEKTSVVKEEKVREPKEPKERKERTKLNFTNPFKIIAADKYHHLFALVAAFLIGFTLDIAIFDIYLGKLIYIFFFICCVIGMVLNFFIYRDTLNASGAKSMEFLVNIAVSIIGIGLSVGGYFIFLSLAKEKPATNPGVALILFIPVLAVAVSVGIAFVLKMLSKKRA